MHKLLKKKTITRCVAAECGSKGPFRKTKLGRMCKKHRKFYANDLASMQ